MAHDPARRAAAVLPPLVQPLLDALCRDTAVAFACYGPDHRYLAVSQALADLNGLSADEHVGRLPTEVLGVELGTQVEAAAARMFADGKAYREPEQRLDGERRGAGALRPGGERVITANRPSVADRLGTAGIGAAGHGTAGQGTPDRLGTPDRSSIPDPLGTPDRSSIPDPLGTPDRLSTSDPLSTPDRSSIPDPLSTPDRLGTADLGTAGHGAAARLSTPEPPTTPARPSIPDRLSTADRLSSQSAGAVRYLDSCWTPVRDETGAVVAALAVVNDVTDRHRIADLLGSTQWRIGKLQTVARELAGALTISEVRAAVAKLGQITGSTHVDLRLLDPVGRSPWPTPLLPAPRRRRPRERAEEERWEWRTLSWPALLAAAVRDGQPCYLPDRDALDLRYPEAPQWPSTTAPGPGEHAWAVLPLSTAVGPVGGLYLVYDAPRGFDEDDRAYLQALAGQCTMAVARARMHEREHRQVVSLQEAILPKRLPELTGVDAAFRYIPGSLDTEVGGDWYDLFGFPDGRIGLVVGDVIGKGITAAAGMGRVRAALRALAFTDPSPRSVLTGLDRLFDATENAESLTTVVYAVLDPATRGLVLSDAGHLPLLVRTASGDVFFLESETAPAATPLGLSEQRIEFEVSLNAGDVVIGFSDGLVETREASLSEGFERLVRAVRGAPVGDLDALLDHTVDEMLRDQEQDDDVTLLAVRIGA